MKKRVQKYIKAVSYIMVSLFFASSIHFLYAQSESGTSSTNLDLAEPSDVENVKAVAGDSEIMLTWDGATDNVGVVSYKLYRGTYSVRQSPDHRYDLPVIPVGNVVSYTVKNLTNSQTYYFSVTAVDAAGNESVNYSFEASATPRAGLRLASIEDDGKSPQVKKVEAEDVITVKVIFSEPVKLPEEHPVSAFQIEKLSDKSRLEVQKAELDARDEKGETILLTTEPQEENAEYIVTSGIEIEDQFGNPVVSGTSDTGSFKGSAKRKQVASTVPPPLSPQSTPEDTEAPSLSSGTADSNNRLSLTFSEPIVLPQNPTSHFTVYKKGTQETLKVINTSLSVDSKTAYLTTDIQEGIDYEIQVTGVKDSAGNEISAKGGSIIIKGKTTALKDTTPPEDVTNFLARIKNAERNIVELSWKASKNSAGDLNDQLLYQNDGKKALAFGKGAPLGTSAVAAEVRDLQGGKWYTFKLTTKDTSGNESKGAVKSVYLPKTGPGVIAAGLTALFAGWYRRRKKKR